MVNTHQHHMLIQKGVIGAKEHIVKMLTKKYLDKNGATKNVVKYASKVRLINE